MLSTGTKERTIEVLGGYGHARMSVWGWYKRTRDNGIMLGPAGMWPFSNSGWSMRLRLYVLDTRSITALRYQTQSWETCWISPWKRWETITHASIWYASTAHIFGAHAYRQPFNLLPGNVGHTNIKLMHASCLPPPPPIFIQTQSWNKTYPLCLFTSLIFERHYKTIQNNYLTIMLDLPIDV